MQTRIKWLGIGVALAGSACLTYDAHAGNLRSSTTPEVLYWYRVIPADSYLRWTGAVGSVLLVDDVTFNGAVQPDDVEGCEFDATCSFFGSGTDLGVPLDYNNSFFQLWVPGGGPVGGGTLFTSSTSSSSGATSAWTANRGWSHSLRLVQAGGNPQSGTIDKFTLSGHAALAIRESTNFSSFTEQWLYRDFGVGPIGPDTPTRTSVGGAGGAGVGTGTGVGGIGWLTETSSARHYQTPYIMHGVEFQLLHDNFSDGEVIIHGRVIIDPLEVPGITNSFSIQPM